jgi:adenosylmethionine---8-amino-7-oxononanoate aminotransferase
MRTIETIITLDVNNCEKSGYVNNVGREIRHHAIAHGVLLCPLGNVLYLMPPYWITENELDWVYQQIERQSSFGKSDGSIVAIDYLSKIQNRVE